MTSTELAKTICEKKSQIKVADYLLKDTLGVGSFGKVKLGIHEITGCKVAIKILNKLDIKNPRRVYTECLNLASFQHPHIIQLYRVVSSPKEVCLITEYVSGGELYDYVEKNERLDNNEARRLFQQIMSAIDYCHQHMIVHRDLKLENILLDKLNNVKIADFGLSRNITDGNYLKTNCGTPFYLSPEVILGKSYQGPEVDIWSCGIILYVMLSGCFPFDDDHIPSLYQEILSGMFYIPDYFDDNVCMLLLDILHLNPKKRATIKDITHNEWFKVNCPDYLFRNLNKKNKKKKYFNKNSSTTDVIKEGCRLYQTIEKDASLIFNELRLIK